MYDCLPAAAATNTSSAAAAKLLLLLFIVLLLLLTTPQELPLRLPPVPPLLITALHTTNTASTMTMETETPEPLEIQFELEWHTFESGALCQLHRLYLRSPTELSVALVVLTVVLVSAKGSGDRLFLVWDHKLPCKCRNLCINESPVKQGAIEQGLLTGVGWPLSTMGIFSYEASTTSCSVGNSRSYWRAVQESERKRVQASLWKLPV